MDLRHRQSVTYYVDYTDLHQYFKDTLGIDYRIVAAEECSNDSSLHYSVDGKDFTEYDAETLKSMQAGNWHPYQTGMLLNFLAYRLKIPKGEYVIEVCW